MILALAPISSATAAVSDICPAPGSTGVDNFADDNSTTHEDNINCAADYGIVNGTTAVTYDPTGDLTRGQAATLLVQWAETALGTALTTNGVDEFSDTAGTTHADNIDKAVDNGLVNGFSDGTYRPNEKIARANFATIAVQATEFVLGAALTDDGVDDFSDDDGVHEANIEKAVDNGIVTGSGTPGEFDPSGLVQRGQTATIAIQAAGNVLFPANKWAPVPASNQTFAVSPADSATLTVKSNPETTADSTDDRQYTVSNPAAGATHTIALFPAANVTVDGNEVTFKDADSNNVADGIGAVDAWISVVNGAAVANDTQVTTVMPSGGTITFTVDGDTAESVIPVVFADADTDSQLDLTVATPANADAKKPSESFGIGGTTTFQPAEAAAFTDPASGTVVQVDKDGNWYTLDNVGADGVADVLVNYVTGDTFTYSSGAFAGAPISMAQFESYLSVGDTVNPGVYNPGATTHDLATDVPNAPTGVSANYRSTTSDVRVTWTKVANPDIQDYQVERATVTNGTVGTYAVVGTVLTTATAQYDDTTVAGGTTYSYRVKARNTTPTAGPASDAVQVSVPAAADTTAPTVSSLTVSDNTVTGTLDANDQVAITLSEAVTLTDTASVTFRDADGTVGTVTRGGNATMSQNAARTVVFITLTAAPVLEAPGTTLGLAPASLETVNSGGIADDAGNALAEVKVTAATPVIAATTVDFTANSPLDAATVTTADFTTTSAATIASVSVTGDTITVTMSAGFAAGDTVTLVKNSINNTEGGNGPASSVTTAGAA